MTVNTHMIEIPLGHYMKLLAGPHFHVLVILVGPKIPEHKVESEWDGTFGSECGSEGDILPDCMHMTRKMS